MKMDIFLFIWMRLGNIPRIDLPGQLSALSPEPIIHCEKPNQATQLGNAVRIDWKAKVQATSFDVRESLHRVFICEPFSRMAILRNPEQKQNPLLILKLSLVNPTIIELLLRQKR